MVETLLVRISKGEHVQDFKEGKLFMSPLSSFADLEKRSDKDKARGDYHEGVFGTLSRKDRDQLFSQGDGPILNKAIIGEVTLISDNFLANNVLCLYNLKIDHERKLIEKPSPKIEEFGYEAQEPPVALCIKNKDLFLYQIEKAIMKSFNWDESGVPIQYALFGDINYISRHQSPQPPHWSQLLKKEPSYSYQNEWRLILAKRVRDRNPIQYFEIGDQFDNILEIPLHDFIYNLEDYFPEYQVVEKLEDYPFSVKIYNKPALDQDFEKVCQEGSRIMFNL